jgi:glycosyltransferase involved in cell wall biosynthesis
LEEKIKFVGYVSDEQLRNFIAACNIFVTLPKIFAGSVGAIKAMIMEKPVLHAKTGSTYEFLKQNNAGVFLDANDYDKWPETIEMLLEGKKVNTIPKGIVRNNYSWGKSAACLLEIIEDIRSK